MMKESQDEEIQEVSEAMQNTLFYEGSNIDCEFFAFLTLKVVVSLCKDHRVHSVTYAHFDYNILDT